MGSKVFYRSEFAVLMAISLCLLHEPTCVSGQTPSSPQAGWNERFGLPGANGLVYQMKVFRGDLYVAGGFSFINAVAVNNIARWDGTNWSSLAEGLNGGVSAMAVGADGIYVGGTFTRAGQTQVGGIARWDGTNWSAVGSGVGIRYVPNTRVKGIALDGPNLYIAGDFTAVDNVEVPFVAKWDGHQWSPVGRWEDISPNGVTGLAFCGGVLYGTGDFYSPDRQSIIYLAGLQGQGNRWLKVGEGVNYYVYRLAVKDNTLFALGDFQVAGGLPAGGFAQWDGARWSVVPSETNSSFRVTSISVTSDGDVLLGESVAPDPLTILASRITRLDGTNRAVVSETGGAVWAMEKLGSNTVCSGAFNSNGGVHTGNLAQWNGTRWSTLTGGDFQGFYETVNLVARSGTNIFAAGNFIHAGDANVSMIAQWNGRTWSSMAGGLNGQVSAMTARGNELYATGNFTSAGGISATNVARWDGTNWWAMGNGLSGSFGGVVVNGAGIYVAGSIVVPGQTQAVNIVHWDGSNWSAVAEGINGSIAAFAGIGSDLYVAGKFTNAGVTSANMIARWDGARWTALGSGLTGDEWWMPNSFGMTYVSALATDGNALYVGGSFTNAGGVYCANVAKWDGTRWSALGNGLGWGGDFFLGHIYRPVLAIAVSGSDVYVGGEFTMYAGAPADRLARWDGLAWSSLGSGVNARVTSLASEGNTLCAAGDFASAGGKPSYRFGIWTEPLRLQIQREAGSLQISWPSWGTNFVLQTGTTFGESNWTAISPVTDLGTGRLVTTNSTSENRRFFRLQSR